MYSSFNIEDNVSSSINEISVTEDSQTAFNFAANEPVSWVIIGGEDQDLFSIESNTGKLEFTYPVDYEHPLDFDFDNTYNVIVEAIDLSKNSSSQELFITVENSLDVED